MNKIIILYVAPMLFLPFLVLLISNEYLLIFVYFIIIYYISMVRKELFNSIYFWSIYYFFLSSLYFIIGYFGGYYDNSLYLSRLVVGFFQFLPLIIFILLLLKKENRNMMKSFIFVKIYFVYILLNILYHNNIDLEGLVFLRNFSMFTISFMIGIFLASKLSISSYFKYLIVIVLVYVTFGFFEQSLGWTFWKDWFNSYFISDLKNAGQSMYGMIGNKTTRIKDTVYLRMTSVYYEPHHLSLTLAYFVFILIGLKKTKLLHMNFLLYLFLLLAFTIALFFTLVKAGYGFFILSFIWLYILKFLCLKSKKISFFILLIFNIFIIGLLLYVLLNMGLGSTANTHLSAALAVFKMFDPMLLLFGAANNFQILNSDSGFATIVFGIGFIGYILFMLVLSEIISYINKSYHPFKYYAMSLVFAWFGTTHLVSSTWSPMVSFLLFFLMGLSTSSLNRKKKI